jgi:hypothetical protein
MGDAPRSFVPHIISSVRFIPTEKCRVFGFTRFDSPRPVSLCDDPEWLAVQTTNGTWHDCRLRNTNSWETVWDHEQFDVEIDSALIDSWDELCEYLDAYKKAQVSSL